MLDGDPDLAFEFYTRYGNPTLRALEEALAALEGAEAGVVFASGMSAATTGILSVLEAGDEVLASASLYGGTTKFVRDLLPKWGMSSRIVAPADLLKLRDVAGPRSRLVVLESPTNPAVEVIDIEEVARQAHAAGLAVMVDNTFASPFLQRPLALGADIVMHSLTKALGGHSDIIGGALVGSRARMEKARDLLKVLGGCFDPALRVPRAARAEDAAPPRGAPVRERDGARRPSPGPSEDRAGRAIPACPAIPGTRSRGARCRPTAGWWPSSCAAGSPPPSASTTACA